MIRKLLILVCTLAMAVGLAGMAPAGAKEKSVPVLRTQAVFNDPTSVSERSAVFDHLEYLIDGAAENSKIRVAMYSWQLGGEYHVADRIVAALVKAHEDKNVTVQVLVDGGKHKGDRRNPAFEKLVEELGSSAGEGSWARFCGDGQTVQKETYGRGCIGQVGSESMHNKFFAFTRTHGKSWVVSNGTSNMTPVMREMWNSQYTVVGDHPLYDRYLKYFKDLAAQEANPSYYDDGGLPPEPTEVNTSYHFPRSVGNPDPMVEELQKTSCPDTAVRIGVWSLTRMGLATQLHNMIEDNCSVTLIVNHMDEEACKTVLAVGPMEIRTFGSGSKGVHQKNLLIRGDYEPARTAVFTGSPNLDEPSLHRRDENVTRTLDANIYEQFEENFDEMKQHATVSVENEGDCHRLFKD